MTRQEKIACIVGGLLILLGLLLARKAPAAAAAGENVQSRMIGWEFQ
jgi:Flp pilus assembly protein protease CpaA